MKIIDLPHGGGKTTALVDFMLEPGNEDVIYVAPTLAQADIARRMAVEKILQRASDQLGYNIGAMRKVAGGMAVGRRFLAAGQLSAHPRRLARARFVIDELDGVLGMLIGGRVLAVALTSDGALR